MLKFLQEFFSFSKKELNGLLVFSIILVLLAIAPIIYAWLNPPKPYDYSAFKKEIQAFYASASNKPEYKYPQRYDGYFKKKSFTGTLFMFNPNGLSVEDWQKLGLTDKQIKVIKNFESKGGKFYKKEDLKKIYSVKPQDYARLEPFIEIPSSPQFYTEKSYSKFTESRERVLPVIELNTADSIQLESLKGVGAAFAARIIKYRTRLGGFYKKEQLKEVYGLDSILYQKLQGQVTINPSSIKQIEINTATFEELKRHPYLSYKQINAIIQYRKQHGKYKTINDLKFIALLNDNVLTKIAPYLSFTF